MVYLEVDVVCLGVEVESQGGPRLLALLLVLLTGRSSSRTLSLARDAKPPLGPTDTLTLEIRS
jgi:hypothetical protein